MEFLRPGFLYLLPMASIPIIIHLISRLRLKIIEFPSIRFLYTTEQKKLSWLKIKDIILLVLRTLILLTILLALARPKIKRERFLDKLHIIIDDSYSMEPYFKQAKSNAIEIIKNHRIAGIRKLSEPHYFSGSKSELTEYVSKIENSNLWLGLDKIDQAENKVLISDLTVPLVTKTIDFEDSIFYNEVGNAKRNWQVYDVNTVDPIVMPGLKNRIKVAVRNIGDEKGKAKIFLQADKGEEAKDISLGANQVKEVSFDMSFSNPGIYTGKVAITSNDIEADNQSFFVLKIPDRLQIGIFYQDSVGLGYLKKALVVASYPHNILNIDRIGKMDLNKFDLVILYGVTDLESWTSKVISNWIQSNKGLILFITNEPKHNLLAVVDDIILPIEWQRIVGFGNMKFSDYHPVIPFQSKQIKVFQYLKTKLQNGDVLAWLGDDPLIIRKKNITVFNLGIGLKNTDFALRITFVPFLYRLISLLTSGGSSRYYVGEQIEIADHDILVYGPEGRDLARDGIWKPKTPGLHRTEVSSYAVNVYPAEGNIKKITEKTRNLHNLIPFEYTPGVDLARVLILLSLVLLLIEVILLII